MHQLAADPSTQPAAQSRKYAYRAWLYPIEDSFAGHYRQKKALETLHRLWYIEHKEGHLLVTGAP